MDAKLALALKAKESLKAHYTPFGLVGIGLTKIRGRYAIKIDIRGSADHPPPEPAIRTDVPVVFTYVQEQPVLMGFVEDDQ